MKLVLVIVMAVVQMCRLGNEAKIGNQVDAIFPQYAAERLKIASVDEQQFVLVELHFHSAIGADDRDARTTVVDQQILKVAKMAHEDGQVDVAAAEVGVMVAVIPMARLQDGMDSRPEGLEKIEKHVEQLFR